MLVSTLLAKQKSTNLTVIRTQVLQTTFDEGLRLQRYNQRLVKNYVF